MKLHLFLIVVSMCSYAFLGWFVYRLAPRVQLNRRFAAFSIFVAAWTLLLFISSGTSGSSFSDEWYANELFSYAPKSLLFLDYALHLTGRRKRASRAIVAALYCASALVALLGVGYYLGTPVGIAALAVLGDKASGLSGWRAAYAVLSLSQYAAGFAAVALWGRASPLKRVRHMAALTLAVGVSVVSVNALIGLLRGALATREIDALIVLQLAQPYVFAFGIAYYQGLRPIDSILSAHIRSQLSHSVAVLDRDGMIVSANAAIEELSGMPATELEGRHFGDLLGEAAPAAGRRLPSEAAEFFEADFKSQGGDSIPMSVSMTPIKDRWGDCEGFVLIGQPIRRLSETQGAYGLSSREREVCLLVMQGLANQEIAERLFISPGTVKNHLYNIYEKTGVRNRVELSRLLS